MVELARAAWRSGARGLGQEARDQGKGETGIRGFVDWRKFICVFGVVACLEILYVISEFVILSS